MGRRFDKNAERMRIVSTFGKDLSRRAKSKCELCTMSGTKLYTYELPPEEDLPEYNNCILICDTCREQIDKPKYMKPDYWRLLNDTMWSEVPVVQVMSIRMLKRLMKENHWAEDLYEQAYASEEIMAWVNLAD